MFVKRVHGHDATVAPKPSAPSHRSFHERMVVVHIEHTHGNASLHARSARGDIYEPQTYHGQGELV